MKPNLIKNFLKKAQKIPDIWEYTGEIYPQNPRVKLLSDKTISLVLCDNGASAAVCRHGYLTERCVDLLKDARGTFCYVSCGGKRICATAAPEYDKSVRYETAFSKNGVSYFCRADEIKVTQTVLLRRDLSCEQRAVEIQNRSGGESRITVEIITDFIGGKHCFDSAKKLNFVKTKYGIIVCGFSEDIGVTPIKEKSGLSFSMTLKKNETRTVHFLTAYLRHEDEVITFLKARVHEPITPSQAASLPRLENEAANRVLPSALSRMVYKTRDSANQINAMKEASRSPEMLKLYGIDITLPIAVAEAYSENDTERAVVYGECHKLLCDCFLPFELVILCHGFSIKNPNKTKECVKAALEREKLLNAEGARGKIKIINRRELTDSTVNLLYAVAAHTASRSMVRIEAPYQPYLPFRIKSVGGGENPHTPHPISLAACGAVTYEDEIGSSWAIDREQNVMTANEAVIISFGEDYFDAVKGAKFSFGDGKAEYSGKFCGLKSRLTVELSERENTKRITLSLENENDGAAEVAAAYYFEPIMSDNREYARFVSGEQVGDILLLKNPASERYSAYTAAGGDGGRTEYCFDRADFWSGRWTENGFLPRFSPCAALLERVSIPPHEKAEIKFYLAMSASKFKALDRIKAARPRSAAQKAKPDTPD